VKEARKFGKAIWDITGKRDVDIVFEHPGEATFPVSCLGRQARRHGGVLRRHVRFQHHLRCPLCLDAPEARAGLALRAFATGELRQPVRARPPRRSLHERGLPWEKIPAAHQMMWKNQHKPGNMAVLVNAPRMGLRSLDDAIEASGGA
jgi:crotonyl-CoA carboxylase/reductase